MFQNVFPGIETRLAATLHLFETALIGEEALAIRRNLEQPSKKDQADQDALWTNLRDALAQLGFTPSPMPEDARLVTLCDRLARLLDGDPEIDPELWRLSLPPATPNEDAVTALLRRAIDLACSWLRLCEPA
jgi:hypothetical protein